MRPFDWQREDQVTVFSTGMLKLLPLKRLEWPKENENRQRLVKQQQAAKDTQAAQKKMKEERQYVVPDPSKRKIDVPHKSKGKQITDARMERFQGEGKRYCSEQGLFF